MRLTVCSTVDDAPNTPTSSGSSSRANAGSPTQPSARLASVMPSWRRRQVGVEVRQHVLGEAGAAISFADLDLDLRRPDLDQRELGGDEEAVDDHEHDRQRDRDLVGAISKPTGEPEASKGTFIRTRWCRARPWPPRTEGRPRSG